MLEEAKTSAEKEVGFVIFECLLALVFTILFIVISDYYMVKCVGPSRAAAFLLGLVFLGGHLIFILFIVVLVMLRRMAGHLFRLTGIKLFIVVIASQFLTFVVLGSNVWWKTESCHATYQEKMAW